MFEQKELSYEEARSLLDRLGKDQAYLYSNLPEKGGKRQIGRELLRTDYLDGALEVADDLFLADPNAQSWGCGIALVLDGKTYFVESTLPER